MTRRNTTHRGRAALLLTLLGAAACAPPPGPGAERLELEVVILRDATVFTFIQVFQVHVLKGTTTGGATVTCSDFPDQFKIGDPRLQLVGQPVSVTNTWNNPPKVATLEPISVPVDQPLVFVVRGLAQFAGKGTHTVARGCADNQVFSGGDKKSLDIDVKASTGAPCTTQAECEPGLFCRTGASTFPGGYCALVPCTSSQDCPPGSTCVSGAAPGQGLCARICESINDCNTGPPQTQDCQGRLGPTSSGCSRVCVYPLWNAANKCN